MLKICENYTVIDDVQPQIVREGSNAMIPQLQGNHTSPTQLADLGDSVQWNKVVKLLLLSTLSAVGTLGNIFAISAIMLEDQLKKRGNIFIVNLAIADFIVSAFAIPASTITILAGIPDNMDVCQFQWFSAILCCHVSVLSLSFVAVENYFRVCRPQSYDTYFSQKCIMVMIGFVWTISTICVTVQFVLKLGPDYCAMRFGVVLAYHASVGFILLILPIFVAFVFYLKAIVEVRSSKWNTPAPPQNPSSPQEPKQINLSAMLKDYSLLKTNLLVCIVFLLFWLPLGIVVGVGSVQKVSRRLYDNLSWLALSNSCVNSFIYGLSNKFFRSAYSNLFHYCCCKTHVSFGQRRSRPDTGRPHSDVRVHIFSSYNMQGALPRQPVKNECVGIVGSKGPKRPPPKIKSPKPKDVYEL